MLSASNSSTSNLRLFGQLVIGPPGSGKTTYCSVMADFLTQLGRKVAIVNLDPANENVPYQCAVDLGHLIRLEDAMDHLGLGPNGGLIYCMDYLYANRDWLADRLAELRQADTKTYLLFDCPGQVELYTHHPSMRQLVTFLTATGEGQPGGLGLQLTAVHLVDSHYCSDAGKFIACLLTSLSTMLQLSLPHVNVLSKADLVEQFGELDFNLDFFTEVLDLNYLVDRLETSSSVTGFHPKYARLNRALVGLIQDQALVQFTLLDVQNVGHVERVMRYVDRANGYVFGPAEQHNLRALMHSASGVEFTSDFIATTQERYMASDPEAKAEEDMAVVEVDLMK